MKKFVLAIAMVAGLAACNSNSQTDRALVGGAVGAGTGALIASAAGANAGTTLGVAAASAVGGAVIGAATTPRNCVNQYGNPVPCP
ncbi:bacteriocin [Acuticoccus kandeliae]|uniref:bacteriocin n=1 Tax=Acuticoccus kandeliae TaxID=2073160 RepID=UPI000D3E0948|nr:bacteriocin [Acuticoccus kandeliae]